MDYAAWQGQQVTAMQQMMWQHPDKYTLGYNSKPMRGVTAGLYAERVLTMHPDEVRDGITFWNQSEREIYELTPAGQSVPMIPHLLANDLTPRHMRIEQLQRRLGCTWKQAERVRDAMKVLDATPEIVDRFIANRLKAGPDKLEAGIEYIERLAGELRELEPQIPCGVAVEDVRATIGQFTDVASRGAEALIAHTTGVLQRDDDWKLADPDPWLVELYARSKAPPVEEEEEDLAQLAEGNPMEPTSILADVIGYHRVGGRETGDWLTRQPIAYRSLIRWLEQCQEPGRLAEVGKIAYGKLDPATYLQHARKAGLKGQSIRILASLVKGSKPYRKIWQPVGTSREEIRVSGGWMDVTGLKYVSTGWALCKWITESLGKEEANRVIEYYFENVPPMTHQQLAYFWVKYRAARRKFEGDSEIRRDSQADKLRGRIWATQTRAQLTVLGGKLKAFQKGDISGSRVNQGQWREVWKTFWKHMDYVTGKLAA